MFAVVAAAAAEGVVEVVKRADAEPVQSPSTSAARSYHS